MSRTIYLKMDESKVVAQCQKDQVGVSAIEPLPSGGVRLVCMSSEGAQRIRASLKTRVMDEDDSARVRHRPSTPLW